MGTNLGNVFALLTDQESDNVSTIAGLDTTDVKPKNDKDNKKKKKKSTSGRGGGKGKEGNPDDGEEGFCGNVVDAEWSYNIEHQHNGRSSGYVNGSGNQYGRNGGPVYVNGGGNRNGGGHGPVYKRSWQVKGTAGDGQANGSVLHNAPADGVLKVGVHRTSCHHDNYQQRNRRPRITGIEADQEFENDEAKAPLGKNQKQEADSSPVAKEVKASDGDNQERRASNGDNQEHKAVAINNEKEGKVSAVTEVLSEEELCERTRLTKEEAERKEKRLARQEEKKREMAIMTLKEYEEQKAKQKAEKEAYLSVSETQVRGVTLDKELESMLVISKDKMGNIDTKQKSKNETMKKNSNIDKEAKLHKTMSIEEFRKLPTGSEVQGQGGPHCDRSEDSKKNTNVGRRGMDGISRNYENANNGGARRGRGNYKDPGNHENVNQGGTGRGRSNYRDTRNDEHDDRDGIGRGSGQYSRNRAPDLSETSSFPALAEAVKPKKDR